MLLWWELKGRQISLYHFVNVVLCRLMVVKLEVFGFNHQQ